MRLHKNQIYFEVRDGVNAYSCNENECKMLNLTLEIGMYMNKGLYDMNVCWLLLSEGSDNLKFVLLWEFSWVLESNKVNWL